MKRMFLGILAGFGITMGSFMVIADTSFFTPTVGVSEGEPSEPRVVKVAAEPKLQKEATHEPKVDKGEGERAPQNTIGAAQVQSGTGNVEDGLKVVLRNTNETQVAANSKNAVTRTGSKESLAEQMFSVQVASYRTRQEAEDRVSQVSKEGFGAFVQPAQVNGAQFFRVRLGPYESKEEAKSQLSRVKETSWGAGAILATESY